jgi:RNA polymerase sigma factor for flagellar operon FliA
LHESPKPIPADGDAIADLVESVRPMVYGLAKQIHRQAGGEFADLVADGWCGAVEAARRYDRDSDAKFSTFARMRVYGAIIDGLRRLDYLERSARKSVGEAIAAAADAGELYVDARTAMPMSLDHPLHNEDGEELTLGGVLPDESTPFNDLVGDHQLLAHCLAALKGEQRYVIIQHYWHDLPLSDIAEAWNVSPSRVSQIHSAGLHRMQLVAMRSGERGRALLEAIRVRARRGRMHFSPDEHALLFGDPLDSWSS